MFKVVSNHFDITIVLLSFSLTRHYEKRLHNLKMIELEAVWNAVILDIEEVFTFLRDINTRTIANALIKLDVYE